MLLETGQEEACLMPCIVSKICDSYFQFLVSYFATGHDLNASYFVGWAVMTNEYGSERSCILCNYITVFT